jgi:hypothetical protein
MALEGDWISWGPTMCHHSFCSVLISLHRRYNTPTIPSRRPCPRPMYQPQDCLCLLWLVNPHGWNEACVVRNWIGLLASHKPDGQKMPDPWRFRRPHVVSSGENHESRGMTVKGPFTRKVCMVSGLGNDQHNITKLQRQGTLAFSWNIRVT